MKYTAEDLLKALKYIMHEATYDEYVGFKASLMGVDKEDIDELAQSNMCSLAEDMGVDAFLDAYNEFFKPTLHIGDVYKFKFENIEEDYKVIIVDYDADSGNYHMLFDDGLFSWTTNDRFDFDNAEKIDSIDTKTFVHSKNELINKMNEL